MNASILKWTVPAALIGSILLAVAITPHPANRQRPPYVQSASGRAHKSASRPIVPESHWQSVWRTTTLEHLRNSTVPATTFFENESTSTVLVVVHDRREGSLDFSGTIDPDQGHRNSFKFDDPINVSLADPETIHWINLSASGRVAIDGLDGHQFGQRNAWVIEAFSPSIEGVIPHEDVPIPELTGRELAILDARDRVERDQIEADRGKMQINDRPLRNPSENLRRHAFGGGDLGREGVSPVEMSGAGQSGN